MDLTFKREFSYYLLTIYVPCCMLVIVSWVSFWLDPNAVPARYKVMLRRRSGDFLKCACAVKKSDPCAAKCVTIYVHIAHYIQLGAK